MVMAQPIYYSQAALEGFAKAFASRPEIGVTVRVGGNGAASVDSNGTINLPGMNTYQTQAQFEDTCATIIHEIAHVKLGSHEEFAKYAKWHTKRLFMDCLNAVMDVADETEIGRMELANGNPRAEKLMLGANVRTMNKNRAKMTKPGEAPLHWQILATGIIKARCMARGNNIRYKTTIGRTLAATHTNIDIAAAYRILAAARKPFPRPPHRPANMHRPLIRMADRLATILRDCAPPDNSDETPMPGGAGLGEALAAGNATIPANGVLAGVQAGEALAGTGAGPAQQSGTGAGGGGYADDGVTACEETRRMLEPVIRRMAERMATDGDSLTRDGGYYQGSGVRDAYRVLTDGACMGRWQLDPHADGMAVAVVLDISQSMDPRMAETAGLAEAFAAGMADCADVRRFTFGLQVYTVDSFTAPIITEGWTETHLAIHEAREWLMTREAGKKVMVVLTDGRPDNLSDTQTECGRTHDAGISLIGIALGIEADSIRDSMPRAAIAQADDAPRLAIELEHLTAQMEALTV
jgi:hypothetical protein